MAGKNSVRIPVSLELQADDVVNDYKNAINKNSNIKELQSQFQHLLDMQKQYIENAKSASDPIAKALNLQGVKAYSEMLSRIQSQITKIDKTKLSDFAIPRFQFNDKEIINNVKNIDKLIDTVVKDIDKINEMESKSNVGNMFKNIGSDSIKKYYKEQREISEQSIRSQIKNNNLSIESINELLNVLQQYEVFNKRIAKKNGAISTNISDILPKDLLKNEKFLETISLDDLQIKWQKITTPDIVENVRSAIIGNLSSRAMNKPLYIPTKGLVMDSDVANDFGAYQNKIDTAKEHLRALSAEFNKVNEFRLNLSDLNFAKDNDKVKNYLDLMFQIKSTMNEIATLSSVIGVNEKDLFKRAQTGLVLEDAVLPNGEMVLGFNSLFDDLLSKENKSVLSKYYSNISTSISEIYTKSMGDITNNSLSQLQAKLQQIDQMISMVSNSSVINDTTISTELDEIVGKENSLNLVLSQRQKIISELEKSGYKFKDKEIKTNTAIAAMFEAEQIRKGFTPTFGQTSGNNSNTNQLNSSISTSNIDESSLNEIRSSIDAISKRVSVLETEMPENTKAAIEEIKGNIGRIEKSLNERITGYVDSQTLRNAHNYVLEINSVLDKFKNQDEITTMQNKFAELTSTVYGLVEALSEVYGEQLKLKTFTGSPRYITEENGDEKIWYRGVNGMMGNGLFSNGYEGAVFYTDNVEVASKAYAGTDGKGKIEKAKIIANKTWEINGNKSSWQEIEYLGNWEDEASRQISTARLKMEDQLKNLSKIVDLSNTFNISSFKPTISQLQNVEKIFDELIKNTNNRLQNDQIEKIKIIKDTFVNYRDEYLKISQDKTNPYGIHKTDDYVKYAQNAKNIDGTLKYDSIVFKNIYDGINNTEDQLSTVAVTLSESQAQYIETLSAEGNKVKKAATGYASSLNTDEGKVFEQLASLSNKISELESKGVQANNADIKTVTADVVKLKERLDELPKTLLSEISSKMQQQIQPLSETIQKLGNLDGVASLKDMFEQVNNQIITINQNLSVMEGKINGIGKNPANVVVPNANINNTDKASVQNEKDTINNKSIDYYSKLIERVKEYNELEAKHTDNNPEEKTYYDDRIKRLQTLKQLQAEIRDIISSGNLTNDERIKNIQINDHNKSASITEKSSLEVDFDKRIGDLKEQQKVAIQNLSNEVNDQKKRLKEITKDDQVSKSNSEKLFEIIQSLETALRIIEHNESLNSAQKKKSELTEVLNRAKAVTVKSDPVNKASAKVGTRNTSVPKSNYLKDHIQTNTTPDVSNTNKLQSQIKSLEKQKNDHQKSIENLTREINKLKSNSDTTKNQSKISNLQTDIANLKKEIINRDNEILYLQKQIEAITQNINPITDTLNLNPSSNKKDESASAKTSKRKSQNTITNTNQSKQEITAIHDINAAVKDLTQRFNEKTQAIKVEAETMKTAADSEVADLQRISDKITELKNGFASAAPAGKIIMPDNSEISVPQKITSANSGSALGSEIAAVGNLKTAFEDAGKAVDAKTTAITTEQTTMANAATTEVADIQKIIDALETLRSKITSLPKINVAGELNASTPVSIIFNYNEDQIKVIREKINAELNGNNAVPISFIPDVKSLKDQIASELKNIPVTLNSNKKVLNVTNIKVDTKTTEALKNNICNSLTELKIQSFSITDNAKTKLINELSGMLNNIGLAFDTSKLQQNISNAIQAAQAMAQNNQGNNSQNSNNQNNNATGNNQNANDALKRQIESYDKLKNKISEVEKQINKLKTYNYNKEFKDDFNSILGSISALGNVDTNNQIALTDWIKKSGAILKNWTKIEQRVKDAANYRATTSARTNYEDIVNKNATQKARNSYAVKKFEQVRDQYTSINNDRGTLTDEQLNVIEQKYKEVYSLILKTGRVQNEFTAENLSKIDQEQQKFSEMIHMFQSANSGTGIFKIDTGRINNEIQKIENTMLNSNNTNLNSSINSVRNLLNQYNQMSANVGKMNYSELEKYAQLISHIKTQVDNIKVSSNAIQNSLRNDNSVNKAAAKMDELIVKMRQFVAQNSRINSDQAMKSQFAEMLRQAEALPKTAANWQMMTRQFNAFKAAVTSKGLTGRSVGDELRYIMEKIGLKAILGNQIYRIIGYLRQMVTVVKEIDSGMTDLKRVSQETETTYAKFLDASVEKAHALGSAMSNVIDATSKFSRLGYNLSEATALAENAIMYSNVGWLDIDTATADITSTMKAFNIEASDSIKIVDTFDILGKKLPLVTISVKGWRHSRPSKDIVFIFVSMKKLKLR